MKRNDKILLIIEFLLMIILSLNIFLKNIYNNYLLSLLIFVVIGMIILFMGYEKDKYVYKKNIVFFICFYTVSFLILMYGSGLILGYIKYPYNYSITSIIKNIFPVLLFIVLSENLRFLISKKGEKNSILFILTIIVFLLLDCSYYVKSYNLNNLRETLEFITEIFFPSLFKNIVLTSFAYRYGLKQNIYYRLILELYMFIIPIAPNLGIYLQSVLFMIYPILLKRSIYLRFEKEKKVDYRDKRITKRIVYSIIILFTFLIVGLNSNLFRYWVAVVGSGSMTPTLEIGDAIVIDKSYQKHLDRLEVGDILVFKVGNKIYTHRIIDIDENNKNYSITTKGDRKEQSIDNWVVTNKDVIGVVKFRIKYIGYPTVWIGRLMEG